jgi:hypothetical protein
MRDSNDSCVWFDCKQIPAGETVKLESPFLLQVGGRPHIKVKYHGKQCYIPANAQDFVYLDEGRGGR